MTTGNPCGMNWRPISETPNAPTGALIAIRRGAEGAFLLGDLYAWHDGIWISEADGTELIISTACEYFWLPEDEITAPLDPRPPVESRSEFIAAAESRN